LISFVLWWVIIQVFGLAALPLARRVFAWLPDRGYAFSKAIGLLMVSYLLWLGAITGILANTTGGILLALLLTAWLSLWAGFSRGRLVDELRSFLKEYRWHVLIAELLFLLAFAGWAVVRAYAPEKIMPAGGEKYMEIAFLNGVLNSQHFPPLDPWMAGYSISYYYFAYVMMAVMTRLSGSVPTVGFDLYDALIFALTALTAYGVVFNLIASVKPAAGYQRAASGFGLLGALFVTAMGNLEGLLEGLYSARLLPAGFWQWIDIPDLVGSAQSGSFYPGNSWWWWHASRVLHDLDLFHKPVIFQPIDEFPFFSFLLGDNHPHKLALPFVLLATGLAFNLFLKQANTKRAAASANPANLNQALHQAWGRRGEIGLYLFYALALGALAFLNTWDFPIYLGLVLLAYAAGKLLAGERLGLRLLGQVIVLAICLGIGSILLYVFFYTSFSSQAGGILPYVFEPTRLPQYLVMFGPFIFILAFFITGAAVRSAGGRIPWVETLRAWAWVAGLSILAFLLVLLASIIIIQRSGLESNPFIQEWLNGMTLGEGFSRVLLSRLNDPWLFVLLSIMLAVIITTLLRSLVGAGNALPGQIHSLPIPHGAEAALDVIPGSSSVEQPPEPARAVVPAPSSDSQSVEHLNSLISPATQFVMLMAFAGLALTLVVEFFYLRDNFGMRMNTIFKFYYQGWVMMACASAYAAWWVVYFSGKLTRAVFSAGAVLLIAGGLVYPLMGAYSRADGFSQSPTLDAAATFAGKYPGQWAAQPDDWAAIQWLIENGRLPDGSVPHILEAGSRGYENAGRISAFTGFPTILGWENHEGQWRGSLTEINKRIPVIQTIYTTPEPSVTLDLLHQWNVRYVIVGDTERTYVSKLCQDEKNPCNTNKALAKFDQALTKVFSQGNTTVYQVPGSAP
jgi:YYY domain-containing protein